MTFGLRSSGVIALVAMLASTPIQAQQTPQAPVIVTPGEASTKRAPDRAWVTVTADAHAPKSADARALGAAAMTDIQTALKGAGVATDAIRTLAFSLQPETNYTNGRANLIGYIAHNEIEVRVDDLNKLPDVLDAANTPKNVSLSINGPRFDLRDRETVQREMLAMAVQNALARARAIADGAHVALGAIQVIENQTAPQMVPQMPMRSMAVSTMGGSVQTPITPGEIEIEARVLVTIAIH
jgi:uncharacterized protein YggE